MSVILVLVLGMATDAAAARPRLADCGDFKPSGDTVLQLMTAGISCQSGRALLNELVKTGIVPNGWLCAASVLVCWAGARDSDKAPRYVEAFPRPSAADGRRLVIFGDTRLGPFRTLRQELGDAIVRFGTPTVRKHSFTTLCDVRWSRLGLQITFVGVPACDQTTDFYGARVTGDQWRTSKGLAIGDTVARLRRLYPDASHRRWFDRKVGWWLVVRSDDITGDPYPALLARTRNGRVVAFEIVPRGVF